MKSKFITLRCFFILTLASTFLHAANTNDVFITKTDTIKEVIFIGQDIESLDDLVKSLNGEKLYIDVWATWCGPCIKEFKNNEKIEDDLKTLGYKKLYVSIDEPKKIKAWKKAIEKNKLKGYHYIAKGNFVMDFVKNHSTMKNGISIPQFIVVDETGKYVSKNAPRPSQRSKLLKVLK